MEFFVEKGQCYKWIFRAWSRTKKRVKFYPKEKKSLRIPVKVDCSFCGHEINNLDIVIEAYKKIGKYEYLFSTLN